MANLDSRQTSPSVLVRIRDVRDDAAWRLFVEIYAPLIYRYCRKWRLQDADATDVSQEVLTQVAQSIRVFEYDPEQGRFRDWLGVVTRNKIRRFLEKQNHAIRAEGGTLSDETLQQIAAPEAESDWTERANAHLLQVALDRIASHFESATWQAFQRVWLENQPANTAAKELQLPVASIYVAKSRVLKKLRAEILLLANDALPAELMAKS
jgi:RNA polymerase sigma factor (sigma-70 family)